MKAQQILTDAIYLSLQDRKFEKIVDGGYLLNALNHLNNLLDEWKYLIPFSSRATFNNIDNLINSTFSEVDSVAYVINRSSTILTPRSLSQFREEQNIIDLRGFPSIYYFDPLSQSIDVYPKPSLTPYTFIVDGKMACVDLGQFDDVPARLTRTMRTALVYEIGFRLAADYGQEWDGKRESIRSSVLANLKNQKTLDLRPEFDSVFGMPNSSGIPAISPMYYLNGGI